MYKKNSLEVSASKDRSYQTSKFTHNNNSNTITDTHIDTAEQDFSSESDEFLRSIVTPRNLPQDSNPIAGEGGSETLMSGSSIEREAQTPSPSPVTPDSDEDSPTRINGNKETDENDEFGELHSEDFFHQSYENSLPATPERENIDVETMSAQFDGFLSVSENNQITEKDGAIVDTAGSIDVFEASFQTAFPPSFVDNAASPSPDDSQFSDSFFFNGTATNDENSPRNENIDAPIDESLSLFPNSAFSSNMDRFETPVKAQPEDDSGGSSSIFHQHLRESDEDLPMDEAIADEEEHSPTLVLKRLQQRKARQQISPAPHPQTHNDEAGGLSINEEMMKLDAIANGIGPSSSRGKQRRTVRQPKSYAEPSLNSKLRRGDVYFQKENYEDTMNPMTPIDNPPLQDRQTNNTPASVADLR